MEHFPEANLVWQSRNMRPWLLHHLYVSCGAQVILLLAAAAAGEPAVRALIVAMPYLNALRLVRMPFVFSIVKVCPACFLCIS